MDKNYIIETKNLTKQYGSQKGEFTDCLEETEPEKRPL